MNPFYKNLALWMVIGLVVVLLFNVFGGLSEKTTFEPNYSDFLKNVDAGLVQSVTIRGNLVTGKLKDGGEFRTYVVESPGLHQAPARQERQDQRPPGGPEPLVHVAPDLVVPDDPVHRRVDLLHAPDAGRRRQGALLRQGPRAADLREAQQGDVRRRGGGGRGQGGAPGDHRVPQGPAEVPEARREDPEGRPPGRPTGDGQDPPRQGDRRRGERPVLLDLGIRLRRDVRRRGRLARAGPVRAGEEARALHHLHGRDRRGRAPPRGGARRRPRRAGADAQPAPGRDGRLRDQRGRDPDRGDQPARRPRPGAPPPGALRPPGRGAAARRQGPGGDPARPRPPHPARAGRRPEGPRPRHARASPAPTWRTSSTRPRSSPRATPRSSSR